MGGRQSRRADMKRLMFLGLSTALLASPTRASDVVEYYHLDAIGNVRAVTNQAGQVIERHDYLPFGEEWCGTKVCGSATPGQPKRFTGKEHDAETGLIYFGARYYGANVGRFTTADPVITIQEHLLDPQRWNRYAYARNNPYRYVDPDGRVIATVSGALIGGAGGALFAAIQGRDVWAAAAGGATAGALFGLVIDTAGTAALPIGALAVVGGLSAGTGLAVERAVAGQPLPANDLMTGLTVGAAFGPAARLGASSPPLAAPGASGVQANRAAGNAFRDELAAQLQQAGRDVETEVYKKTLFGGRFIDIEVSQGGKVLGGIETKVGGSRYLPSQRAKDWLLKNVEGYPVNVARDK
jgi:RHS repeat-associated protein